MKLVKFNKYTIENTTRDTRESSSVQTYFNKRQTSNKLIINQEKCKSVLIARSNNHSLFMFLVFFILFSHLFLFKVTQKDESINLL
jgi:hypothetical protein